MPSNRTTIRPQILVIDVGGSHVKCLLSGETKRRKFASGPGLTPQQMVDGVLEMVSAWAKKWRRKVHAVVEGFRAALLPDEIVISGGKTDRLKKLPPRTLLQSHSFQ